MKVIARVDTRIDLQGHPGQIYIQTVSEAPVCIPVMLPSSTQPIELEDFLKAIEDAAASIRRCMG